jgi:hypothetical protein
VIRTIAMPIVEPIGATWPEFRSALTEAWGHVTRAANWMMTALYARDVRRQSEGKIPPMPRVYLYPEARCLLCESGALDCGQSGAHHSYLTFLIPRQASCVCRRLRKRW